MYSGVASLTADTRGCRRSTRSLWTGTILLTLCLLSGSAGARAGEDLALPSVRIGFEDGLLELDVSHRPWGQVLEVVEDQTGMRFHHVLPLKGSVSVAIPPLPVKRALKRLFGPDAGLIFRYRKGVSTGPTTLEVPAEVWILGHVREDGAEISSNATPDGKRADGSHIAEAR